MAIFARIHPFPTGSVRRINLGRINYEFQSQVVRASGRATVQIIRGITPRSGTRTTPITITSVAELRNITSALDKRPRWRKRLWKTARGYTINQRKGRISYIGGFLPPRLYVPQAVEVERRFGPVRTAVALVRPVARSLVQHEKFDNLVGFFNEYLNDLGLTPQFRRRDADRGYTEQEYYREIMNSLQRDIGTYGYNVIGRVPRRRNPVTEAYLNRIDEGRATRLRRHTETVPSPPLKSFAETTRPHAFARSERPLRSIQKDEAEWRRATRRRASRGELDFDADYRRLGRRIR